MRAAGRPKPSGKYQSWTKVKIMEQILIRQQTGKPLNYASVAKEIPRLCNAARKHFGSWETAILESGIDYDTVRIKHPPYTKKEIINYLRNCPKDSDEWIYLRSHSARIAYGVHRHFGTWEKALKAAGIKRKDHITTQKITKKNKPIKRQIPYPLPTDATHAIMQLKNKNLSLRSRQVRIDNPVLHTAAIRYFGCWGKALTASGIDHESVGHRRKWSAQRVIDTIQKYDKQGIALNYGSIRRVDAGLIQAALKQLGSWNKTLIAAGFDPQQTRVNRRPWTRNEIIDLIRKRYKAGLPYASYNVDPLPAEVASRKLFGSWKKAIHSAGVPNPSSELPIWTKVKIVEHILSRQQANKPLYCYAVAHQHSQLYNAARRYFGNWDSALTEAGIDPQTIRKRHRPYTKSDITEYLRNCTLPENAFNSLRNHSESIERAARKLYGTWANAIKAAGVHKKAPK
jgi:arsenate reductase-like glutaredoxin family protein